MPRTLKHPVPFEGDRVRRVQDQREGHLPQARLARGRQARRQEVVRFVKYFRNKRLSIQARKALSAKEK